jgi:hypothetical protein
MYVYTYMHVCVYIHVCIFIHTYTYTTLADLGHQEKKGGGEELQNWHTVRQRKLEFQSLAGDFNSICRFHVDESLERAALVEVFE